MTVAQWTVALILVLHTLKNAAHFRIANIPLYFQKNLRVYEGKSVIQGPNVTVERGDYLCIVGENGSGKSTLVKGLLRLKAPHILAFNERYKKPLSLQD
jgi:ABC-type bacteriocin/lantibiotic exporter with double-glycine peptidase domain